MIHGFFCNLISILYKTVHPWAIIDYNPCLSYNSICLIIKKKIQWKTSTTTYLQELQIGLLVIHKGRNILNISLSLSLTFYWVICFFMQRLNCIRCRITCTQAIILLMFDIKCRIKNLHGGKHNKMLFMVFNLVTVFTEKDIIT